MRNQLLQSLLVACTLATALAANPALANGCPPAGGQQPTFPSPDPTTDIQFVGRGWGHGVGMSQYAARGGALLGCSAAELLTTMFPGTTLATNQQLPDRVRVGLYPSGPTGSGYLGAVSSLAVENVDTESLTWQLDNSDLAPMPVGATWTVSRVSGGGFSIAGDGSPAGTLGNSSSRLTVALSGTHTVRLPAKNRSYRYGRLEIGPSGSTKAWVVIDFGNLEKYLHGLGEMPASWGDDAPAALQAQAIAARNYAVRAHGNGLKSNCQCHLYDSTADQVYKGLENEDSRWTGAVDDSSGSLLLYNGATAQTFYSSSHGGHSEASVFTWGGDVPYLQPVDVSAWEAAANVPPNHAKWSIAIDPAELGDLFGIGPVIAVDVPHPRGVSGRIGDPGRGFGGVVLQSIGETVTVSGNVFRSKMNSWSGSLGYLFRSTLFRVVQGGEPPIPLTGDWDGDGADDVGWFREGAVALRKSDGSTIAFAFGQDGDLPVTGDWDGDGVDTIGVVRDGTWKLRNSHSSGAPDVVFGFGTGTDTPVVGNWDGIPGDEPGIRRGKTFRLKHTLGGGSADEIFGFGIGTDIPITGDFDADGTDDVGVVRSNAWRLKFSHEGGSADVKFWFARPNEGDLPVTGDWNNDGLDTVGVVRDLASFRLKNEHAGGTADLIIDFGP